jgi:UDP-N-acetylglucosamine 3-dehydrogenase
MTVIQDRLRIVFLGCGAITRAHGRRLRALRKEVQCFFASRDPHRAAAFEEELSGAGSFGSYEAALADGRMDVAFIATPPPSHLELTLEALRNGKDVIVEKPAFLQPADFDKVREAQRRTGRRVMVAENYCYKPLARSLRQLIERGEVGEVRFIQVNALKHQQPSDWRSDAAQAGGGALFEGGIHWVDFITHLGLPVRSARVVRAGDGPIERSSLMVFRYEGGAVGTLAHSWETSARLRGLQISRITGTRGSIHFESNGLFVLTPSRLFLPGATDIAGYMAMFRDLVGALRGGHQPGMTLDRAQRSIEMLQGPYWEAPATPRAEVTATSDCTSFASSRSPSHAAAKASRRFSAGTASIR